MERHRNISGNTLTGTQIHQGDVINHYPNSSNGESTCFEYLCLTDPRDDKKRIIETKGGLLEACCAWIFTHDDFLQWRNDPQTNLLWIKGDPGKGKTMLLCSIIDELEFENFVTEFGLAFFFCDGTRESTSATAVLRGLIYMLVKQTPSLLAYVQDEYKRAGKRLFEDVNAWVKLSDILINILKDPAARDATLVVDALDECSTGQDGLVSFIVKSSSSGVKWIVSSRNWKRFGALEVSSGKITLSLELNETFVAAAVNCYIEHKIEELSSRKGYDDMAKLAVRARLCFNSGKTFLWVSFLCHELGSSGIGGNHDTLALLNGYFPKGLAALYDRMLESINTLHRPEIRRQILTICMVVYRPITLHELATLLRPQGGPNIDVQYMQEIVVTCGAFLTLREGTVHFIHQSAKEYLFSNNALRALPSGPQIWHHNIFVMSVDALNITLRRNMYKLESPGRFIEDVVTPCPDPLAPIQYCCTHWIYHLRACGVGLMFEMKKAHILMMFLKVRLLQWLEALSLIKAIPAAASAIRALNASFQEHKKAAIGYFSGYNHPFGFSIHALVEDLDRFVSRHKWTIQTAPLQVYASAIVFSPSSSLVKIDFQKEFPMCEAAKRSIKSDWGHCIQTLEGHAETIDSIVFSRTGDLASASRDGVIKIWDATGTNIQTLQESAAITPILVAFSPDGSSLASGSGSRITLWQIAGGYNFRTIDTGKSSIDVLCYIKYSCYILTGSSNGTFNVWDLSDGICVQTCEADRVGNVGVTASLDGRRCARMYHDAIDVFFFDSKSRFVPLASFHSDSPTMLGPPFYLSMTNYRLIYGPVGLGHQPIRVLDLVSRSHDDLSINSWPLPHIFALSENSPRFVAGTLLGVLYCGQGSRQHFAVQGHDEMITSVAFCPDDSRFASASADKMIKIWDFPSITEVQQQQSEVPARLLNLFAGSHFASTVSDRQVRIYNVDTGQMVKTYELDQDSRVFMSRDNQQMVITTPYSGLQINNVKNGRCLLTVLTEIPTKNNIHLSDDNLWLASVGETCIKIVSVAAKRFLQSLHSGDLGENVSSMAFSADGKLFATGSILGVIRIWDLESGTILWDSLDDKIGRAREISSMAFSLDAQWIAYALVDFDNQTSRINLLNFATEKILKVCTVRNPVTFLSFGPEPCHLQTNLGTMFIDLLPSENEQLDPDPDLDVASTALQSCRLRYDGYGLSPDGVWIMRGRENWLRIPPDYRSRQTAISGRVVTIMCLSGELFIMNLPQLD